MNKVKSPMPYANGFTGLGAVVLWCGDHVAGIFGAILFVLLLIGDWYQFTSLGPFSAQYGFGIARRHDRLDTLTRQALVRQFGTHDVIALPHGVARWFTAQEVISLRPSYHYPHCGYAKRRPKEHTSVTQSGVN